MTAREAIGRFDALEPNPWGEEEKLGWLHALESSIEEGVFARHTGAPAPHGEVGMETELHATPAYEGMYIWFLSAMHHLHAGEITRYNNDMSLFSTAYGEYVRATHRSLTPKGEKLGF